ncbi:MAG: DUF512 domain-containing protein [Acetanaerobacterium sp.]
MPVLISGVTENSPACRAGLRVGDTLLCINSNNINDVLDYRFYMTNRMLELEYLRGGQPLSSAVKKGEYEELGLAFDTFLMDRQRSCKNQCIFCFVDQLPPGLRDTLYFKDDDSRMSFLLGNYITLTNMTDEDIARIVKMKISPINISVHTTNPELRVLMMKNRHSGDSLRHLKALADGGIRINAQLVLCPGINDGDELVRSLTELAPLYPSLESIALVPVGITKYRDGLFPLSPYTVEGARETIRIAHEFADAFYNKHGTRLVYPADEFFIKAQLPIPDSAYYGDFDQLDNGVGLIAILREEFRAELEMTEPSDTKRQVTIATGVDAQPFIAELVDELKEKWHNLTCGVIAVPNVFFGPTITVAGLITGRDLIAALAGCDLGEELLIPEVMLRYEKDMFLDSVTVTEAEQALGVRITCTSGGGASLLHAICGQ